MKVVPDAEAERRLEDLGGGSKDFQWDDGNRGKNRKQGVSDAEVESMFEAPIVFMGRIVEPRHDEWRGLVLGSDATGRPLALVFTWRGARLRPISCRPMRRGERIKYEQETS